MAKQSWDGNPVWPDPRAGADYIRHLSMTILFLFGVAGLIGWCVWDGL